MWWFIKKWFKNILGEPWLAINRRLTMHCLGRRLRRPSQRMAYEPISGGILYVAASSLPFHISGYTTRTHEILCALGVTEGINVHALTRPGYPWDRNDRLCDPLAEATQVDEVVYQHARKPSKWRSVLQYAVQAAPVIAKEAKARRVAVIHAASNHTNALPALLAARMLGIPFYYELRGLWELTRVARMPNFAGSQGYYQGLELEELTARNADKVFVISEQLKRYLQEQWNIPSERMALLPNCIDPERVIPVETPSAQPDLIGYAGSLINYEGLDVLVDAISILVSRGQDIQVRIAGDGEARPQLEEQVRRLGLTEHIHFLGRLPLESARDMVSACTLVCIPRRPFIVCKIVPPIKLVEAMALAKPVVVPDLPVFRDELGNSESGWFFKPADAVSLAEVIAQAFADKTECAARGRRGREHAVMHRNWQFFVSKIAESYKK